eukprot:10797207-Prorocentrum_lima.AAC.1
MANWWLSFVTLVKLLGYACWTACCADRVKIGVLDCVSWAWPSSTCGKRWCSGTSTSEAVAAFGRG